MVIIGIYTVLYSDSLRLKETTLNPYLKRTFHQLIKVFICVSICSVIIMLVTNTTLSNFIDSQRVDFISFLKGIQNFLEISIAIYAAVISIFATARTTITDRLSKNKLHIGFTVTLSTGLVFNAFSIFTIPMMQFNENIHWFWLLSVLIITIIALCYIIIFFITLIQIFTVSVDMSAKEINDEEEKYNELIELINKIEKDLNSKK